MSDDSLALFLKNADEKIGGFKEVPFRESLSFQHPPTDERLFHQPIIQMVEKRFYSFCQSPKNTAFSIPRLVHFVWLGSPVPPHVAIVIESWRRCNPNFTIKVWTEAEVEGFAWSRQASKQAFFQSKNWAEASDILRYEILYQEGGIYSDADQICLGSFETLVSSGLTFFAAIESNSGTVNCPLYLGAGVVGAQKGNFILGYCIERFENRGNGSRFDQLMKCGPGLLSRSCGMAIANGQIDNLLVLPCSYFYPLSIHHRKLDPKHIKSDYIAKESLALHLWRATWS